MREEAYDFEYQDLLDGIREQERVRSWGGMVVSFAGLGACWLADLTGGQFVIGGLISIVGGLIVTQFAHVTVLLYKAELRELLYHGVPPDNETFHAVIGGRKKRRKR